MKLALFAFASLLCVTSARAGDESLLPLRVWDTNIFVVKLSSADFDGNGRQEVVTFASSEQSSSMDIFRIGTNGDVLSHVSLPATGYAQTATADFDGDGYEDMATAGSTINVYRGGPSGVPTLWQSVLTSPNVLTYVVAADFNGDTWPDILVSDAQAGATKPFKLLKSMGGVFFQQVQVVSAAGMFPHMMELADLNVDGELDVLASEYSFDRVRVLLAGPTGLNFTSVGTHAVADQPQDIRALDLTGDGVTDFAVALRGTANGIASFAGTGGGNFGPAMNTPAAGSWGGLDKGDIDGDGDEDLVLSSNDHYTWAFTNVGGPLPLAAPKTLLTMPDAPTVLMTDVNGDGWRDLIAGPASASAIVLGFGGPQGLQLPTLSPPLIGDPVTLDARDFTGDGKADVLSLGGSGSLALADGHGDGSFGTSVQTGLLLPTNGRQTSIGLINGDALPDVVVLATAASGTNLRLALGNGAAKTFTLGGQVSSPISPAAGPLAADLDGDGAVEICAPLASGVVREWHINGSNAFVPAGDFPVPEAVTEFAQFNPSTAGDLDEDGFLDLVFTVTNLQRVFVMPGQADGDLGAATILVDGPGTSPNTVFVVDIDEDGLNDIVATAYSPLTSVWLGQAGMGFGAQQTAPGGPRTSKCADIDADGHLDLVGVQPYPSPGEILVQRGHGDGTFRPALSFATTAMRLAVADFTSDGIPDVAVSGDAFGSGPFPDEEHLSLYVTRPYTQFDDLGFGLGGSAGEPEFFAWGWLQPGEVGELSVARAAPSAPAAMFIGLSQALLPFKGGTLVPSVDIVLPGFVTDADGRIELGMSWPSGVPAGLDLAMQWWFADGSGPANFTASNALTAETP